MIIFINIYRVMVELAEGLGRSDIYGLLNPYFFNSRETTTAIREELLKERLDAADKKLYLLPYWIS